MLTLPPAVRTFLCAAPADLRKSFDGLAALVRQFLGADPLTTVTGKVLNLDGSPGSGAQVAIDLGDAQLAATTAADGTFTVAGVPTLQGQVTVTASLHLPCGVLLVAALLCAMAAAPRNPRRP